MNFFSLFCIFSMICIQLSAKVWIIVPSYNRPDFIELQAKTFKKFLKNEYEFYIFNDADNESMQREIENECARNGVVCINVPQRIHNHPQMHRAPGSFRHGEVLQYAFEQYFSKHDDIVMIIDSDMFLMRDFDVREYLGESILNLLDGKYFPLHFGIINIPKLPHPEAFNFHCKILPDGTFMDVGYEITANYIPSFIKEKDTKSIHVMLSLMDAFQLNSAEYSTRMLESKGYSDAEIQFILEMLDLAKQFTPRLGKNQANFWTDIGFYEFNLFLDYKHGSSYGTDQNHPNKKIKQIKDRVVRDFINKIIGE